MFVTSPARSKAPTCIRDITRNETTDDILNASFFILFFCECPQHAHPTTRMETILEMTLHTIQTILETILETILDKY